MENGELFAVMDSIRLMQMLSVDSWAIAEQVDMAQLENWGTFILTA